MRIPIAFSLAALAVATIATPGEAQTIRRNGGNVTFSGKSGVVTQRSFNRFSQQSTGPSIQRRSLRVQPPQPGNLVTNVRSRSLRVQPPQPGNLVTNVPTRTLKSVQPPQPGGNVSGPSNRSFRSLQPPPPGGAVAGGRLPSGAFQGVQPPLPGSRVATAGSFVPTAAAGTAAPTAPEAAVATSEAPAEMLATVGAPIEPLAKVEVAATPVATRIVRKVVTVESCNPPSYRSYRHRHHYLYRH